MKTDMKLTVSIDQDEDGVYIAECPSIPGCVSQGHTEGEAEASIADASRECLAVRAQLGMPATVATRGIEIVVRPRAAASAERSCARL
jgi:predicted RNase H-like HicB family nuclease